MLVLKTTETDGDELEELGPKQKPLRQVLNAHWSSEVHAAPVLPQYVSRKPFFAWHWTSFAQTEHAEAGVQVAPKVRVVVEQAEAIVTV